MFVAKIKRQEPEQFILTLAEDSSTIKHTSDPMSEDELRIKTPTSNTRGSIRPSGTDGLES